MSMPELNLRAGLVFGCLLFCAIGTGFSWRGAMAADASPGLGRTMTGAELAGLPRHVFADGLGLPPGAGSADRGEKIYAALCAGCHGSAGQGGSALELVGDRSLLATEYPDRGIAVYWPYAPTLFEYIRRAMPPDKPYSLSNDDVYAVIARLLELNGLIEAGQQVDAALLSTLRMPNRNNFRNVDIKTEQ